MHFGELKMKKAAGKLPPIELTDDHLLEVSYLTGKKYWHQTAFCAYSLAKIFGGRVKINIYSDGSLTDIHMHSLKKALPNIVFVKEAEIQTRLEQLLPVAHFPVLRSLRESNPFFRKLIDMRLNNRYIVQLDSDMIFFNTPNELVENYNTSNNFFMQDVIYASYYVLPENILEQFLSFPIKPKINSGILAYNATAIDWKFVENTCEYLYKNGHTTHPPMLEQTLNAIIMSQLKGQPLSPRYRILYDYRGEEMVNSDIVRHYIFKAKLLYFTSEWKKIFS